MEPQNTCQGQNETEIKKRIPKLFRNATPESISSGLISGTLAITGPPIIILEAASNGHFSNEQTISWMFSIYFFGGILGILMPLFFRLPINGGHSLSGVAFLVAVTSQFTYSQLIGGYVID